MCVRACVCVSGGYAHIRSAAICLSIQPPRATFWARVSLLFINRQMRISAATVCPPHAPKWNERLWRWRRPAACPRPRGGRCGADPWERPLRCDRACARSAARGANGHTCGGTRRRQRKQMMEPKNRSPAPSRSPPMGEFLDLHQSRKFRKT